MSVIGRRPRSVIRSPLAPLSTRPLPLASCPTRGACWEQRNTACGLPSFLCRHALRDAPRPPFSRAKQLLPTQLSQIHISTPCKARRFCRGTIPPAWIALFRGRRVRVALGSAPQPSPPPRRSSGGAHSSLRSPHHSFTRCAAARPEGPHSLTSAIDAPRRTSSVTHASEAAIDTLSGNVYVPPVDPHRATHDARGVASPRQPVLKVGALGSHIVLVYIVHHLSV